MEYLIYTILKAFVIGIVISAPMGPVGVLCIQRTLDKGRKAGLYTGVGASISDLFYCIITAFGLSFVEEFLTRNQNVIQLIGSLVLVAFGVYIFRKNPAADLRRNSTGEATPKKDILTGFAFTVSNPLIVFLIIGLFARFNFLGKDIMWYHHIAGFVFIITGALFWWWSITWLVNKVRAHFNLRSMWLINRITGTIIFAFSAVGIITAIAAMV
ncbi:MAG: LysE family transporter [Muribaculaceae bacterium]|nr:LysE family transporter [Muribaculaceae bacterium]